MKRPGHLWVCDDDATCKCDPRTVRYIETRDALDEAMSVLGGTDDNDVAAKTKAEDDVVKALDAVRETLRPRAVLDDYIPFSKRPRAMALEKIASAARDAFPFIDDKLAGKKVDALRSALDALSSNIADDAAVDASVKRVTKTHRDLMQGLADEESVPSAYNVEIAKGQWAVEVLGGGDSDYKTMFVSGVQGFTIAEYPADGGEEARAACEWYAKQFRTAMANLGAPPERSTPTPGEATVYAAAFGQTTNEALQACILQLTDKIRALEEAAQMPSMDRQAVVTLLRSRAQEAKGAFALPVLSRLADEIEKAAPMPGLASVAAEVVAHAKSYGLHKPDLEDPSDFGATGPDTNWARFRASIQRLIATVDEPRPPFVCAACGAETPLDIMALGRHFCSYECARRRHEVKAADSSSPDSANQEESFIVIDEETLKRLWENFLGSGVAAMVQKIPISSPIAAEGPTKCGWCLTLAVKEPSGRCDECGAQRTCEGVWHIHRREREYGSAKGPGVARRQVELTSILRDLADVTVWMTGSSDFSPEGKAGAAWTAWGYPRLDRALKTLERIPGSTSGPQPGMVRRPVVIESPYAGDVPTNLAYATAATLHSLDRNEAPYASHLFFTQMLDDADPEMRARGMEAGFAIGERLEVCCVYVDRGISGGMMEGVKRALARGQLVEFRSLERDIHPSEYPKFLRQCGL